MATTAKKAPAKKAAAKKPKLTPVPSQVQDKHGLTGKFVKVVKGEHQGKVGAIMYATAVDADGVDAQGILRTRDDNTERVLVNYADCEETVPGRAIL